MDSDEKERACNIGYRQLGRQWSWLRKFVSGTLIGFAILIEILPKQWQQNLD